MKIEVETESLEQVKEAVDAGADIIMLDNMPPDQLAEAVQYIKSRSAAHRNRSIRRRHLADDPPDRAERRRCHLGWQPYAFCDVAGYKS